MRSSKSRSRSKSNRNRNQNSGGNVVNRVFDSSGPEGKVRGTPQQIIDKYNQLARDAQLSNDRVAAENFQQHAEHYLRLLADAMREMEQRREEQERINRERQMERDRDRSSREQQQPRTQPEQNTQPNVPAEQPDTPKEQPKSEQPKSIPVEQSTPTSPMMPPMPVEGDDTAQADDSGLVETPESAPPKPAKPRARRKPKPKASDSAPEAAE
ncbi:MAG: DUF4167 domain-containing protein [Paracoccaceae bacterium]